MDPFTQRMLERAKLRREKLDSHLSKEKNMDIGKERNMDVGKSKGKFGRLAELASKINQWEDDLDHPRRAPLTAQENTKIPAKSSTVPAEKNEDVISVPKSTEKIEKKTEKKCAAPAASSKAEKQVVWDQGILQKLESQGFSRSPSQSKLLYKFEAERTKDVKTTSPRKSPRHSGSKLPKTPYFKSPKENADPRSPTSALKSPANSPRMGIGSLKDSSVMKKAAMFESNIKSSPGKPKDPTELPVSERKALFEKNKGQALVPKCAFATSLPAKMRSETKLSSHVAGASPKKICIEKNENKFRETTTSSNSNWSRPKTSEIRPPVLKNLWGSKDESQNDSSEMPSCSKPAEPPKSVVIKEASGIPDIAVLSPPPPPPPMPTSKTICSPPTPKEYKDSPEALKVVKEVKKIHFSPGKSGKLYPSLSDIEVSDESDHASTDAESFNGSKNSNIYLNMSFSDIIEASKNNPVTPPAEQSFSRSRECHVLNEMDELLEEALGDVSSSDEDSSTPPKMSKSSSFVYKPTEPTATTPLLHTVSFYRKQQQNSAPLSTPVTVVRREKTPEKVEEDDSILVENKIQGLLEEINKQQTIISQASQALNLCLSTVEFSGSGEQVEGERLLLLASHKRQACLNEIQRLKVENSIRPQGSNSQLTEKGDVTITNITVPLKREALHAMATDESMLYLMCLVKCDERVMATSAASATREHLSNMTLRLPGQIKLEKLLSDFKVTVEVYSMSLSKELLPHDVKYHITNKKDKKLLTPIKSKKCDSKLVMPCIQSPAGPNAVRTSNFQMCGYLVFSLREVTRTQWTLNKVPYISPLEGSISMKIQSELQLDSEFRGFLTMFDDISGFGAWHRRWCLLSSHTLSYWKYPDDENKKVPMGTIDLREVVTENVGLVSRDICARLHTFLLETTRPRQEDDKESLVLNINVDVTRIRHLLSADSKPEMLVWCRKLNTTLALLRAWRCNVAS